jgi:hypothetical protein
MRGNLPFPAPVQNMMSATEHQPDASAVVTEPDALLFAWAQAIVY